MRFTLEIETDNAAFDGNLWGSIADTLRTVADNIDRAIYTEKPCRFVVRDINGNKVGSYGLEEETAP